MQRIRLNRAFFGLAILITATTSVLGMLSEVFKGMVETVLPPGEMTFPGYIVILVVLFVIFLPLAQLTARKAGRVLGVEVSAARADRQPALPFLVMGYSPLTNVEVDDLVAELEKMTPDTVASSVQSFADACRKTGHEPVKGNRWQQNLRSAWHHRDRIRAVYVLDPDRDQFEELKHYLTTAFVGIGRTVDIHRITASDHPDRPFAVHDDSGQQIERNYEDYSYVYKGLRRGLQMIRERDDLDEITGRASGLFRWSSICDHDDHIDRLTCIDATAGQKSFSIAAAVLTLNRPLRFSYVTTASKPGGSEKHMGGEIRFYDTNILIAGK